MIGNKALSSAVIAVSAVILAISAVNLVKYDAPRTNLKSTSTFTLQAAAVMPRLFALAGKLPATPAEQNYRLTVLADNLEIIAALNRAYEVQALKEGLEYDPSIPMYGVTPLALFSPVEFEQTHNGLSLPEQLEESGAPPSVEEWQQAGLAAGRTFKPVIRDQGNCGGCWAFSTVLTLEKLALNAVGTQYDFSMQYLIDCDEENKGCQGGWPTIAYNFVIDRGVPLLAHYPYVAKWMPCKEQNKVFRFGKKLKPAEFTFNLRQVKMLLSHGVYLGLAIYGGKELQYIGNSSAPWKPLSCKNNNQSQKVSHAVTIVDSTDDYITIQNSWTELWGDKGFKKIIPCDSNEEVYGLPSRVFTPIS
jgi:Papain family cysteine protease